MPDRADGVALTVSVDAEIRRLNQIINGGLDPIVATDESAVVVWRGVRADGPAVGPRTGRLS